MKEVYGRWTVIGEGRSDLFLRCQCSCGTIRDVNKKNLRSGISKSCGCLRRETSAEIGRRSKGRIQHGMTATPEYRAWCAIKQRCTNQCDPSYEIYGGRGIKVCERWLGSDGFMNFYNDVGPRPSPDHSIDRFPDKNGNYEPENVRWATRSEQNRNTRYTMDVIHKGTTQCIQAWSEECGIPANVLAYRIHAKWDLDRAFTEPVHRNVLTADQVAEIRRRYDKGSFANGGSALAKEFNVSFQTILRIVKGQIQRYKTDGE